MSDYNSVSNIYDYETPLLNTSSVYASYFMMYKAVNIFLSIFFNNFINLLLLAVAVVRDLSVVCVCAGCMAGLGGLDRWSWWEVTTASSNTDGGDGGVDGTIKHTALYVCVCVCVRPCVGR